MITIPDLDLMEGETHTIDITNWPTGLYYVMLNGSNIPAISKTLLKE